MYTYKVKIVTGGSFKFEQELTMTTNRLDTCQQQCLPYLKKDGDKALITSPTGRTFTVLKKDGAQHWRFPGFIFN
jgi:hypothetical protein